LKIKKLSQIESKKLIVGDNMLSKLYTKNISNSEEVITYPIFSINNQFWVTIQNFIIYLLALQHFNL